MTDGYCVAVFSPKYVEHGGALTNASGGGAPPPAPGLMPCGADWLVVPGRSFCGRVKAPDWSSPATARTLSLTEAGTERFVLGASSSRPL